MSYPRRVSNAGWYPDPSGQPGQFRYWDGSDWSAETASHPSGPPPGAHEAPTQFPGSQFPGSGGSGGGGGVGGGGGAGEAPPTNVAPGYGQQPPTPPPTPTPQQYTPQQYSPPSDGYGGYQQQPSWGGAPSSGGGGGNGKTIGLVVGVVVLVIALGIGTFFLVRALSGDDDEKAGGGEESSSETESGTETTEPETETTEPETPTESTTADPTGLACAGGTPDQGGDGVSGSTLTGGGIAVDQVAGYEPEFEVNGETYSQNGAFDFADGMTTVSRLVTDGWVAGYGVGSLARDRGYENPQQAAETAMSCLEQSDNYQSVTRRDDLEAGDVDLGPTTGYSITSDILAEAPGGIPGDRVVITVVDLGDDQPFGFYINYVPLGYNDLIRTQQSVGETLRVP